MDMFGESAGSNKDKGDSKLEQNSVKWEYKLSKDSDLITSITTSAMIKV